MSRLLRLFQFVNDSRRGARARPRCFRPLVERLEDRWLLSATPTSLLPPTPATPTRAAAMAPAAETQGVVNVQLFTCLHGGISDNPNDTPWIANSFVGVGFQGNVVGYLDAQLNGSPYTGLDTVKGVAQIHWGDGTSSAGDLVDMGTDPSNSTYEEYQIKGTHAYQQANPLNGYDISVYAQGPDGTSLSGLTATAFVSPMLSKIPAKSPAPIGNPSAPGDVSVQLFTCLHGGISNNPDDTPWIANSFVGVGFRENVVGILDVQVNGSPYTGLDAVKNAAQINWGDSAAWDTADLVDMGTDPSNSTYEEYLIKGTHTYQQANPLNGYDITAYAQGPDGTSLSGLTATAFVSPMLSKIPGTPPTPIGNPSAPGDSNVQLFTCLHGGISNNPDDTPWIANSFVGVGFQDNVVGYLDVQVNGSPYTGLDAVKNAAQINWGDSAAWDTADLVDMGTDPSNSTYEEYLIEGSHTYQQTNPLNGYDISVYAQGPDRTSLSGLTATAFVGPNPYGLSMGNLSESQWDDKEAGYDGTIPISGGSGGDTGTITGLPKGLTGSVVRDEFVITGTPQQSGTFDLFASVDDSAGGTDNKTFTLAINAPLALGDLSPTAWKQDEPGYDGAIDVRGGSGNYSDATVRGLPAGLSYFLDGGSLAITGTPTESGPFTLGVSVEDSDGEQASGTYDLTIDPAHALTLGGLSPTTWKLNQPGFDGTIPISGGTGTYTNEVVTGLPAGLRYALSGNTISITGTPTQAGTFRLGVSVHDSIGDRASGTDDLTIQAPALTLGPLAPTQWKLNQPGYDGTIHVSGGSGTYTNEVVTGLPAGLRYTLSGNTISVTGTPTQAGTFRLGVSVHDSIGDRASDTDDLTIEVPPLTLGLLAPAHWTLNQPGYDGTIHVSGGSGTYTNEVVTGLPAGLRYTLSGSTIAISGTPTRAGTFHLGVSVHDSIGDKATGTDSLTIQAPALTLGLLSPTEWTVNQPGYDGTIRVSGGSGTYGSVAVTGLPAGLRYSLSGNTIAITGTPTEAGTFPLGVSIRDSIGDRASGTDDLTINEPPLALGPLTPDQWGLGQPNYDGTIRVSGGTGNYTVALVTGLPKGLKFSLSGNTVSITGTPQEAGIFYLGVWVQDSSGSQAEATYRGAPTAAPQQANNGHTVHGTDRLTITSADLAASVNADGVVPNPATNLNLSFFFGSEKLNVPVTITNRGNAPASGQATVSLYLSPTQTLNATTQVLLGSANVTLNNLAANGGHQTFTFGVTRTPNMPAVTIPSNSAKLNNATNHNMYYLVAKVSSTAITDSNPNNNVGATSRTFEYVGTPTPPPPPPPVPPNAPKGAATWFWSGQNVPAGYKDFYRFLSDTLSNPTPSVPLSTVPVVLRNNATTAASGPWSVTVQLTLSPPPNSRVQPKSWTQTVSGTNLAAGAEQTLDFNSLTMPANLLGYSLSASVTRASGRGIRASQFTATALPATRFVANNEGLRTYAYIPGGGDSNPTIGYGINLNTVSRYPDVENALAADVRAYYKANYPTQYNNTTFYNQNLATSQEVINLVRAQARTNTQRNHTQVITATDAWNLLTLALPHYQTTAQTAVTGAGGSWSNLSIPQQVALDDLAYNYGTFPRMTRALVNGDYPEVAFNLCDAARTTQATGLNTRTEAELELLVYGHLNALGRLLPQTNSGTRAPATIPMFAAPPPHGGATDAGTSTPTAIPANVHAATAVAPGLTATPVPSGSPGASPEGTATFSAAIPSAPTPGQSFYLVGKAPYSVFAVRDVQDLPAGN
jgi:GH24 family phage-related lysozyme (muramidase)